MIIYKEFLYKILVESLTKINLKIKILLTLRLIAGDMVNKISIKINL